MANIEERKQLKYIQILRNSPSKKVMYYLSAFTFLVALLLVLFAVRPTILTITGINKEIKEKESIKSALEKKIDAMAQLDSQYIEFSETIDGLQLIFPTSGNFSLFLSNIDAVISRNGFSLKGISFSEYESEEYDINSTALKPWSVQLSVIGPENNIDNLFEELEAMPMFPVIERFSYSDSEDESTLKSFSIALRIYHIENYKFYSSGNESD